MVPDSNCPSSICPWRYNRRHKMQNVYSSALLEIHRSGWEGWELGEVQQEAEWKETSLRSALKFKNLKPCYYFPPQVNLSLYVIAIEYSEKLGAFYRKKTFAYFCYSCSEKNCLLLYLKMFPCIFLLQFQWSMSNFIGFGLSWLFILVEGKRSHLLSICGYPVSAQYLQQLLWFLQ